MNRTLEWVACDNELYSIVCVLFYIHLNKFYRKPNIDTVKFLSRRKRFYTLESSNDYSHILHHFSILYIPHTDRLIYDFFRPKRINKIFNRSCKWIVKCYYFLYGLASMLRLKLS